MLTLNPGDNQGIRDTLLGLYLKTNNLEGARRLLARYPGSHFSVFNWGRVLERILSADLEGARASLVQAQSENRYVKDYLTGIKALPRRQPDFYSPEDKREACVCVAEIGDAWRSHPQAIEWLRSAPPISAAQRGRRANSPGGSSD